MSAIYLIVMWDYFWRELFYPSLSPSKPSAMKFDVLGDLTVIPALMLKSRKLYTAQVFYSIAQI